MALSSWSETMRTHVIIPNVVLWHFCFSGRLKKEKTLQWQHLYLWYIKLDTSALFLFWFCQLLLPTGGGGGTFLFQKGVFGMGLHQRVEKEVLESQELDPCSRWEWPGGASLGISECSWQDCTRIIILLFLKLLINSAFLQWRILYFILLSKPEQNEATRNLRRLKSHGEKIAFQSEDRAKDALGKNSRGCCLKMGEVCLESQGEARQQSEGNSRGWKSRC